MSFSLSRLVFRGIWFYRWTSLGVFLSAVVGCAVLVGSLAVGDSVDYSLGMMGRYRLGSTETALIGGERFFRAQLADELAGELDADAASVLLSFGMVSDGQGQRHVNNVQAVGVGRSFFEMSVSGRGPVPDGGQIVLNELLAERLGVDVGDEVVLGISRPSMMGRGTRFTPESDLLMNFRLQVSAVVTADEFGLFSLQGNQVGALNAYLCRDWLGRQLDRPGQANLLLLTGGVAEADRALADTWRIADAELELGQVEIGGYELRSGRVFIDEVLAGAALEADQSAVGVLTYFVNELRTSQRSTPYSMVAGIGPGGDEGIRPADLLNDEIVINRWLADDLQAGPGDEIELVYYSLEPDRRLSERSRSFVVRSVVEMQGPAVDGDLMPDFPGLADAESCRDWQSGLPVDLGRVRERDEQYWDDYRGTPKGFVTLEAARSMWANEYGNLTAVRYGPVDAEEIAGRIVGAVEPGRIGLGFHDVGQAARLARHEAMGFGQLFVGFNMFLIAAALVLIGLVFAFGVETRAAQMGILKAVGYGDKTVKRLFLLEASVLAGAGVLVGAGAGLVYTRVMIWQLGRVFGQLGDRMLILYNVDLLTVAGGVVGAFVLVLAVVWASVARKSRLGSRVLLEGGALWQYLGTSGTAGRGGFVVAGLCGVGALVLGLVFGYGGAGQEAAGAFFGIGALVLVGLLGVGHGILSRAGGSLSSSMGSLGSFAVRNAARRRGRTLAATGLLGAGIFVVIAVGANRQGGMEQGLAGGTGGYDLFGESAISVPYDLGSAAGLEAVGLDVELFAEVELAVLRRYEGDDASCFNLNRAQRPGLLGVEPGVFAGRFDFVDATAGLDIERGWGLLEADIGADVVPAVGDAATVRWALGMGVGDEIEYVDRRGERFSVRIVGMINNSVLQGSLVISEGDFRRRFGADGFQMFLAQADADRLEEVQGQLSRSLGDYAFEVGSARQRLERFAAVENTYISIFQLLGGLGVVLGSVGLGLVVFRNVLDREGELAMLAALGYKKIVLKRMVFYEHLGIMLAGAFCGIAGAAAAVAGQIIWSAAQVPWFSLTVMVAAIVASGFLWIWLAVSVSVSGEFYEALRNE